MSATNINDLLNDKLFQVIGSTPESIAESLTKIDLKNRTTEGAQVFAIAIFAAAVNKPTLETFLADARFSTIRPLLSAAMSIQGRANMTAITLMGHCFLTTDLASSVTFATEFRKKMGQNHLWDGALEAGSLSEKQRAIMKEKKRVTDSDKAKALGMGFLKWTGLVKGTMSATEASLFNVQLSKAAAPSASSSRGKSRAKASPEPIAEEESGAFLVDLTETEQVEIPEDVWNYRKDKLLHSDEDIVESIRRNGTSNFITRTRRMMKDDPEGVKTRGATTLAGSS